MIDMIVQTIETFLQSTSLDLQAFISEKEDGYLVDLSGPDRDFLLEKNGELLTAFQLIFPKLVKDGLEEGKHIFVESEGYRQSREEELREIALMAAQKVKKMGERQLLSPLNPYERRIIHLTLRDDSEVFTRSEGDGFLKSVGIHPNPDPASA